MHLCISRSWNLCRHPLFLKKNLLQQAPTLFRSPSIHKRLASSYKLVQTLALFSTLARLLGRDGASLAALICLWWRRNQSLDVLGTPHNAYTTPDPYTIYTNTAPQEVYNIYKGTRAQQWTVLYTIYTTAKYTVLNIVCYNTVCKNWMKRCVFLCILWYWKIGLGLSQNIQNIPVHISTIVPRTNPTARD